MTRRLSRFVLVALTLALTACTQPQPRWNVLLVTFDTTRADHIGCYGRESARTPTLDQIAAEGVRFDQAMSAVPVTFPSHSTIHTGLYPPNHGVRDNGLFNLPPEVVTLAEIMRDAGYRTGAAVGAFPLAQQFGINQGFEIYDDKFLPGPGDEIEPGHSLFFEERKADQVNAALFPWLEEVKDEPFFAWLHYFDPHQPLDPPSPYDQIFRHNPYDGEIAFADQSLGSVRRQLEEWGVWDRTLVVVVGDHGEGLGEHGEDTHSMLVYNSTLRVPFLMRLPDGFDAPTGRVVTQRVGTVDVTPTIVDIVGVAPGVDFQGRSLVDAIRDDDASDARGLYYAETLAPRLSQGFGELRAIFEGPNKYIHGPRPELYDLAVDPKELDDLVDTRVELATEQESDLQTLVERLAQNAAANAAQAADDETRRKLEALGYISAGGADPSSIVETLSREGVAPQDRVRDNSLMSLTKQRLQENDPLAARDLARQLIERAPDNLYYTSLLALALIGLGDIDEAAAVAEEHMGLATVNEGAFLEVVRLLFFDDPDRAMTLLESELAERETARGRYLLGEMFQELGRPDNALVELERAVELDSDLTMARLSAAILRSQNDPNDPEIENHYQHLLDLNPINSRYH
ncbi:MAG: sulfatase-like hydrolase/transferase [Acidobacteriota bacterium]